MMCVSQSLLSWILGQSLSGSVPESIALKLLAAPRAEKGQKGLRRRSMNKGTGMGSTLIFGLLFLHTKQVVEILEITAALEILKG